MKLIRTLLIAAAAVLAMMPAAAQNGTLTPYSRYGYGILHDGATSAQRAMGGVGYAMNSGRQINAMNPASYAMIDSLTFLFDMGIDLSRMWTSETVSGQRQSAAALGAGLDYVTMSFPLWRGFGASIGLLPYSSVGYSFGNKIDNGNASRQGSGSLNELYGGVAYNPFKGFSLGVNMAYLFGSLVNDTYAYTDAGSTTLYERQITVRDWRLDAGLQYSFSPAPRTLVGLGVVYSPAHPLHGHLATSKYIPEDAYAQPEPDLDEKLNGNYTLAESWGAGINLQCGGHVMAEADFTYQPWSKAKYAGVDGGNDRLDDRWKVAVGGQYQYDPRGNYVGRMLFRVGGYYTHDYLRILGNNVREYGATLGLGLPVPGHRSLVSVGVEWKHRQAAPEALVREDYINITLGINFNEMWFRKAKIY